MSWGLLLAAVVCLAPSQASALDVTIEGGPHVALWSMSAQLSAREHTGFAWGIGGRAAVALGDHLRVRVGYQPGHYTTGDGSEVDRAIFSVDVEGLLRPTPRSLFGIGLRVGADHVAILETNETHEDGSRRVTEHEGWGVAVMPFAVFGHALSSRMQLEIEAGLGLSYLDGRVQTFFGCLVGFVFAFEISGHE